MNGAFRQSMTWLHTWSGLVFCWILYLLFVTGTLGYFDTEIDRWMTPEVQPSPPATLAASLQTGAAYLQREAPDADRWFISPAGGRDNPHLGTFWQKQPEEEGAERQFGSGNVQVPSAEPVPEGRATGGGQLLYRMHYRLHYLPGNMGFYLVAVVTMFMFIGLITGIVAHKKIFKDFFTFRWSKGQRSWLDMHNLMAVSTLPFQLMITYSGLLFTVVLWMPFVALGTYGFDTEKLLGLQEEVLGTAAPERSGSEAPLVPLAPLAAEAEAVWGDGSVRSVEVLLPGDANARVNVQRRSDFGFLGGGVMIFDGVSGELIDERDGLPNATLGVAGTLIALHEGLFAGPVLRWLYFLAGLLGTGMIATGAIYWAVKRKPKTIGAEVGFGYRFVEGMNVGTIVGLLIGVTVFFWANRLLPVSFEARADWEVHCMFIAWVLCIAHGLLRPGLAAWREQCWVLAALCLGLPVLNALTTDQHLLATMPAGDWVMAGFDLTAFGFGIAAMLSALAIGRRLKADRERPTVDVDQASALLPEGVSAG
ncbi:MAG: PepSY-associated TM helix domain-containing protein [Pseudomonadota bacterium]